jgi:chaperonin GroES
MSNKKIIIQPFSDFLFLKWEKKKETKKGVILSDTSKSRPAIAEVIAVGPGRLDRHGNLIETQLKSGHKVVVDPFIPQPINIEGEEFWVVRESEIYGKIN